MTISLVTGASGFIGRRLYQHLAADGVSTCGVFRTAKLAKQGDRVANLLDPSSVLSVLADVNTVFHCAGYAHAFSVSDEQERKQHWQINFDVVRNLVDTAGRAGVRSFVFLSSVKAMAEPGEACIDESFPGIPVTDYGRAKRAAEEAVLEAGARYGMHVVNLRLAMVYGAGGRGNLERMGRLIRRGLFPPLPETANHRSLVHVDDVVSVMRLVAVDERAAGKTYIVAHPEAPSGCQLYDAIREAVGLPRCTWAVPAGALTIAGRLGDWVGRLTGRRLPMESEVVARLLHSAWYSPARIENDLGWRAKVSLVDGLSEMLAGGRGSGERG